MSSQTSHVEVLKTEVLSNNWYVLRKVTFRLRKRDGSWEVQSREAYDRGNGATILLYDHAREACAGLLDADDPETCIAREAFEETGYEIRNPRKVMQAYMSPGSVTEILYFFVAEYSRAQRVSAGGGVEEEDIEVLELPFDDALGRIASGEIRDAKTIMLLQYAALHLFAAQ